LGPPPAPPRCEFADRMSFMVTVWIPSLLRAFTQGLETVKVSGATVRQIIDSLDAAYPGMKDRLCAGGELRSGMAVVINSEVAQRGLSHPVPDNSEVHFVPAIGGGAFGPWDHRRSGVP
jgi:molybdopterin synthase sulfur carrier subunit